ncbi:hypothetical protein DFS33DRAFT_1271388 [Desarmillaria ectypa]|nr:hypothetical protein DFS33DRAFT_1271388 [Desarmillaria ectypa]
MAALKFRGSLRAKDDPSLLAEFGHPDVAISLTCLSYYYSGLTENQLDTCFQLLYKQDDPFSEYESWIKIDDSVPASLRHLSGVNTKDGEQWSNHLIPLFQRNHAVADFYLSQVVFPKQAKEVLVNCPLLGGISRSAGRK